MSNSIGDRLRVTVFGQSHAPSIGMVMEGLPPGWAIDWDAAQAVMDRRAPGKSPLATQRREGDVLQVIAGLNEKGLTCGAPLSVIIANTDARSKDYEALRAKPRPGHADYTAHVQLGPGQDIRGGGQFSGRMTAPLCAAGAICMQLLAGQGIALGARIAAIGRVQDGAVDPSRVRAGQLQAWRENPFPTQDSVAGHRMQAEILSAKAAQDSVGGIIEVFAVGVPPGWGAPMFNGLENRIAQMIFAIPGVRGVEFGMGFSGAALRGSQHNDGFCWDEGQVRTRSNHHGGILGGMSTGMPIVCRVAIKPTPSIGQAQQTVDLNTGEEVILRVEGRHDPCIVPRAVVCVEAALALALADFVRWDAT